MRTNRSTHFKLAAVLVAVIIIILVPNFLNSYLNQRFTLTPSSGQEYVGFGSDFEMEAGLPASFSDDVIIPMTFSFDDQGLIYQGEKPLPWGYAGGHVTFTMRAIGRPGNTMDVWLLRMTKAEASRIQSLPMNRDNSVKVDPVLVAIPANYRFEVVGP